MKILKYRGKHADEYWLADTDERETAAFRALFTILDELTCYQYAKETNPKVEADLVAEIQEIELSLGKEGFPASLRGEAEAKRKRLRQILREERAAGEELALYQKAKAGDDDAMKQLLVNRQQDQYEEWEFILAKDPLE